MEAPIDVQYIAHNYGITVWHNLIQYKEKEYASTWVAMLPGNVTLVKFLWYAIIVFEIDIYSWIVFNTILWVKYLP